MKTGEVLLEVRDLEKHYPVRKGAFSKAAGLVKAVDGISFDIQRGETVGLVGESGSGKTTVARCILRLIDPTAGSVRFEGIEVLQGKPGEIRKLRRKMQMIFQDPFGSLNPRMTAGAIIGEGLKVHGIGGSRSQRLKKIKETMARVGLDPGLMNRYPHEFSGGQRQRIGIARALVLEPSFILCDEPVSSLDVSIQSQILNLLMDLKDQYNLTYLFIAHDLAVVEYLSDRVLVMYLGRIVESARAEELYRNPLHPYTQALLAAIPVPEPGRKKKRLLVKEGALHPDDAPSPNLSGRLQEQVDPGSVPDLPPGCPFHPRCPLVRQICRETFPRRLDLEGHQVWCHAVGEWSPGN